MRISESEKHLPQKIYGWFLCEFGGLIQKIASVLSYVSLQCLHVLDLVQDWGCFCTTTGQVLTFPLSLSSAAAGVMGLLRSEPIWEMAQIQGDRNSPRMLYTD